MQDAAPKAPRSFQFQGRESSAPINCDMTAIRCCISQNKIQNQLQCFRGYGCEREFGNGAACQKQNLMRILNELSENISSSNNWISVRTEVNYVTLLFISLQFIVTITWVFSETWMALIIVDFLLILFFVTTCNVLFIVPCINRLIRINVCKAFIVFVYKTNVYLENNHKGSCHNSN